MSYYVGSLVHLTASITDTNGSLVDPGALALLVVVPNGVSTTYTLAGADIVKDDVGKYHYDLTVNQPGTWLYEWTSSGGVVAVQPGDIEVLPFPTPEAKVGFTYNGGANPRIDNPRMLIGDTAALNHIFEDSEIIAMYAVVQSQFQSGMLWSGGQGQVLPSSPVSYLRVSAYLLKALAANRARMMVGRLLDATLTPAATAKAIRDQANDWLETEDNAGAFVVIEKCVNGWGFLDRFYKQVQRQTAQ